MKFILKSINHETIQIWINYSFLFRINNYLPCQDWTRYLPGIKPLCYKLIQLFRVTCYVGWRPSHGENGGVGKKKSPPIIFSLASLGFGGNLSQLFFVNNPSILLRPDKYNNCTKLLYYNLLIIVDAFRGPYNRTQIAGTILTGPATEVAAAPVPRLVNPSCRGTFARVHEIFFFHVPRLVYPGNYENDDNIAGVHE